MNIARLFKPVLRPAVLLAAAAFAVAGSLLAADAPATPPAAAPFVFTPPKEGEVLAPGMRDKLLAQIKYFLDRTNPGQVASLRAAPNPFYPPLPPAPAPTQAGPATAASTPAAPAQISSADKLQAVADQLKPTGALIGGQSRLLVLPTGDTLAVGQSIQVTFPGDNAPTEVQLQDVSPDNFTLKLADATKSFPYYAKESASHPSSSTTTPQPKTP